MSQFHFEHNDSVEKSNETECYSKQKKLIDAMFSLSGGVILAHEKKRYFWFQLRTPFERVY